MTMLDASGVFQSSLDGLVVEVDFLALLGGVAPPRVGALEGRHAWDLSEASA